MATNLREKYVAEPGWKHGRFQPTTRQQVRKQCFREPIWERKPPVTKASGGRFRPKPHAQEDDITAEGGFRPKPHTKEDSLTAEGVPVGAKYLSARLVRAAYKVRKCPVTKASGGGFRPKPNAQEDNSPAEGHFRPKPPA